ncbi:DUF58 domain-containing protein [Caldimonas tepidiphila]|uniref:DUF58 domain-containing protein n=1 Tax=Caldimonas tepidiphila TaxID=2315841 RepID=UPI000E5B791D|nr:DUF58 domain-containing protein [Caldimonas tepidiphila]
MSAPKPPRAEAPPPEGAAGRTPAGDAERLLHRLEWTVLRRLDGLIGGDYRTLFRGAGMDLAELREYQLHDDVRHIDWNVTARLEVPHVREFQTEREATAWFLLDMSGSLDFGAHRVSKRELLLSFVAVMARLLTRHGNRLGVLVHDGRQISAVVPARGGREQALQVLHRLQSLPAGPPAGSRPQPGGAGTDLTELFARAGALLRRRSMVFLVSDFLCAPGWSASLGQLALRHDVLAVRLFDPLERELPDLGVLMMQDAETGEQLLVDTHSPGFRRRFAEAAQRHEAQLRIAFGDAGVDVLELATDGDLVDALVRFIGLRKLRARMAAGGGAIQGAHGVRERNQGAGHVLPLA